jgi:hypothetical protein
MLRFGRIVALPPSTSLVVILMKPASIPAFLALSLLSPGLPAQDIRPGLWRITLESRVAATPGWQPAPFELTQCLTEDDARHPERLLTGLGGSGVSGCDFPSRNYGDGHLGFEVSCAGQLGLTGHGELDFTATRIDGTLDVSLGAGERIDMGNALHAVYLGECAGSGAAPPAAMGLPGLRLEEPPAE